MLSKKSLNIAIFFSVLTILVIAMIGTVSAGVSTGIGASTTPIVADPNADVDSNPNAGTTTPTDTTPTTPTDTTTTTTNTGSSGSGSSGGGGGGSYSSSQPNCLASDWNCTKWSECKNSTQTRVCTLTKTNCKVLNSKPEESLKCIVTTPINNTKESNLTSNTTEEELNSKSSSGITASAIGAKIMNNWIIIVSVIFVAVILLTYFFWSKIRKEPRF